MTQNNDSHFFQYKFFVIDLTNYFASLVFQKKKKKKKRSRTKVHKYLKVIIKNQENNGRLLSNLQI